MSTRAADAVPHPGPDHGADYHWQAFTWQQRRDAGSFVDELWATLETFFNGMLDAHEKAIPRRLRRERGQI